MRGIEPPSPTWKEGVMTIIRHSRFGWNQTSSVHRDLVVNFRQSVPRHTILKTPTVSIGQIVLWGVVNAYALGYSR